MLETAQVPGTSNPEPGGIDAIQAITMIRGLAIRNEVLMIDFVEWPRLLLDIAWNSRKRRCLQISDTAYLDQNPG